MILVPLAQNVLTFLALWEVMSLASYFLVITEHEREGTLGAGWVYFVMTHAGFAALLLGFLLRLARAVHTLGQDVAPLESHLLEGIVVLLSCGLLALFAGRKERDNRDHGCEKGRAMAHGEAPGCRLLQRTRDPGVCRSGDRATRGFKGGA